MKICNACYQQYGPFQNVEIGDTTECEIHRLISNISAYTKEIEEKIKNIEFETFVIGVTLKDKLQTTTPEKVQAIKKIIAKPIGQYIEDRGKKADFKNPDITIHINTISGRVKIQIHPIFIYGEYNKYKRGIPQTKWPCRNCKGKGCEKCNFTGKQYPTSVEELIAKTFLEVSGAKDESFHGAGREDIDARMLGDGRPFILELKEPQRRTFNLEKIEKIINEQNKDVIAVHNLKYACKKDVAKLKEAKFDKTYIAEVECNKEITKDDIEKINEIKNVLLEQYTPARVEHRRAKKTRHRSVYYVKVLNTDKNKMTIEVKAESGTYIKEFISGDDGRTTPSISEILNKPCRCTALDVIKIWW